jgi:CRISPR/Cas system-associated protein Csm6
MSSVDKAMQGAERTLTSDQEQDQEEQRKEEVSPPVKEFTIPEPRKKPWKLNLTTFSMQPQGKKRSAKEI